MKHNPMAAFAGRFRTALIVDDHPLYAEALRAAVTEACPGCAGRVVPSLAAALAALGEGPAPDLILYDLRLPDADGPEGFARLRAATPAPILVISAVASQATIDALMAAGAAGFMPKEDSSETLRRAMLDVAGGRTFTAGPASERGRAERAEAESEEARARLAGLTPQQTRIMAMICDGKANKQIAWEMSLAEASVKAHITALLRRLGVQNRTQAALMARRAGICGETGGTGGGPGAPG